MKDKIEKVLFSYDVEFSNDSTYSERGIRREDYSELVQDLVKLFCQLDVVGQNEQLNAFVDFYNSRKLSPERINYDEIDIFLESI